MSFPIFSFGTAVFIATSMVQKSDAVPPSCKQDACVKFWQDNLCTAYEESKNEVPNTIVQLADQALLENTANSITEPVNLTGQVIEVNYNEYVEFINNIVPFEIEEVTEAPEDCFTSSAAAISPSYLATIVDDLSVAFQQDFFSGEQFIDESKDILQQSIDDIVLAKI